ncbi:MAG: exodeoxyribonuclease III [Chloracidobacterium sp.]|nr:exodeoxyribonuclease III [Chloracidobacterium sp.]
MKIATWNVNSIAVRTPQALDWIEANRPDALCLQETKCVDAKFPFEAFRGIGYTAEVFGQPTYNGVAILSPQPMTDTRRGLHDDGPEAQKRLIATTIKGVRIVNVYIPNGSEVGSEKYQFKLEWLSRLRRFLDENCDPRQPVVLCGDFNVAPEDRDVHDPVLWAGKVLCSQPERDALQVVRDWGLIDVFRQHHADGGSYSWWDYRAGAFPRNHGLRIDHLWATTPLAAICADVWIDKASRALPKASDHAPVVAEFIL